MDQRAVKRETNAKTLQRVCKKGIESPLGEARRLLSLGGQRWARTRNARVALRNRTHLGWVGQETRLVPNACETREQRIK